MIDCNHQVYSSYSSIKFIFWLDRYTHTQNTATYSHPQLHTWNRAHAHVYTHAHSHTCTRMGTIRMHTVTLVRAWALYACTQSHLYAHGHYTHAHSHTCTRMGTIRMHTVTLVRAWALYACTQSHLYAHGHYTHAHKTRTRLF